MKSFDYSNYSFCDGSYISAISGVPTSTLSYWGKRQREDPNYHHHLKATDEEEGYITDYIEENIFRQVLLFQN